MQAIHRLYRWISPGFRRRRFLRFRKELPIEENEAMLDVGGYPWFWSEFALQNPITLLNLEFAPRLADEYPDFAYVTGDACRMPFADRAFPVVFSNSVIEHVGTWERQQQFAAEARRVGRRLWVQTPAREFFVEPHLLAPFIHWLPARWKRRLIRHGTIWGWLTRPTPEQVDGFLSEVRLLRRSEMRLLFPDCEILTERLLGLPKSYIAIRRS
jgi:hypothetical protein